jgi:CheY-like chemotaxis protein
MRRRVGHALPPPRTLANPKPKYNVLNTVFDAADAHIGAGSCGSRVPPGTLSEVLVQNEPLIAIVDDDDSVRNAIRGLMRSLGYAVEAFASAKDFMTWEHRWCTACLIADVNMPEMTGPELYRHLVAAGEAVPTILITAYPNEEVRARALRAGVMAYLTKPFAEADLLHFVRSALAGA